MPGESRAPGRVLKILAASCRESSTVRNAVFLMIRLLTPPQAAGNALAFAVQMSPITEAYRLITAKLEKNPLSAYYPP
jgi:hypothetical protein